ncbi:MAG: AmmeMemoRadiSam system protein A, partial [Myxococcales bacterium]|nr:AmmeMemoRadiSam system protein A [Myxococcales bacterium]
MSAATALHSAEQGRQLLAIARNAVAARLGLTATTSEPDPPWLRPLATTFVTVTHRPRSGLDGTHRPRSGLDGTHRPHGELHGCIGTIEPHRPLGEDVRQNAIMAAFRDPRSRALRADELDAVDFSVSLLGPREPLSFADEPRARAALRPQVDGLVLHWRQHRGVFLPQVWESLPEPRDFLDQLKRKAGLP